MRSVIGMLGAISAITLLFIHVTTSVLAYIAERDSPRDFRPTDCIISDRGCGADGYMDWPGTSEKRVDLQIHEMVDAISSTDRFPVRFEKGK